MRFQTHDAAFNSRAPILRYAELQRSILIHLRVQEEKPSAVKFMSGLRIAMAAFLYGPVSHAENSPERWSAGLC